MPRSSGLNIARIVYDSYPHNDLLPIDPDRDCRDLQTLVKFVKDNDIGDGLFRFLVLEIVEGGEGTLQGAIRVVRCAMDDVEAVLRGLIRAQSEGGTATVNEDGLDDFLQDACMKLHEMWCDAGGADMSGHELTALNDVLTQFFADKQQA